MKSILICCAALAANLVVAGPKETGVPDMQACPALRDTVVLIIRHAEKPDSGQGLSTAGQQRAESYVKYFQDFTVDGKKLKLDCLFATADSQQSQRPRLTLEPLGKTLGLQIDHRVTNKKFEQLTEELRAREHGKGILVCWHHGEIPEILKALGADPNALLPKGKWPDDVFGWVLELPFDHEGRLNPDKARRINEHLQPGDKD